MKDLLTDFLSAYRHFRSLRRTRKAWAAVVKDLGFRRSWEHMTAGGHIPSIDGQLYGVPISLLGSQWFVGGRGHGKSFYQREVLNHSLKRPSGKRDE